jgi:putative transposase
MYSMQGEVWMVFETSSGARYQRRLPHFRSPGSVYHVRSSVNPLLGRFNEEWMLEYSVLFGHKKTNLLHAYIIMPNHIHLVIEPLPVTNTWNAWCDYRQFHRLENIVRRLKSYSGRAINKRLKRSGPVWLDEYFDRIIRDDIDLDTVIDYIHHNPVRWGLVEQPEQYRWSSMHTIYSGRKSFADWFEFELPARV